MSYHWSRYFTPKPIFRFTLDGGYYECTITLPPNAAIQTIVGPANQNSHVAKKLACLEACKRLHQSGALNDHLLPCVQEHLDDVKAEKTGESAKGAGMHLTIHMAFQKSYDVILAISYHAANFTCLFRLCKLSKLLILFNQVQLCDFGVVSTT